MSSSTDSNSGNYAVELREALKGAGLRIEAAPMGSQGPGITGIIIYIFNPDKPSEAAKELLAMFSECDVHVKVKKWEDHEGWPLSPDFIIFVTREQPESD